MMISNRPDIDGDKESTAEVFHLMFSISIEEETITVRIIEMPVRISLEIPLKGRELREKKLHLKIWHFLDDGITILPQR